jgi:DNA gyrase subunit B
MSTDTADTSSGSYTEDNMTTKKDAEHIRQNPGMYVGNTQSSGLHHLVYEIVSNSVDEALAGFCTHIRVALHADGSCSVADDGRGIPVGIKKDTGKSALEEALTIAGNSGKFNNDAYRMSIGLHGMGAKAMTALSEWAEAEVRRDGRVYKMDFERGYATSPLQELGPASEGQRGTTISFKPDPEMFGDLTFSYETLLDRFRELAYLNRGLKITLTDERDSRSEVFKFDGGISEYVVWLNTGETPEHPPIYIRKEVDYPNGDPKLNLKVIVEVALQYTTGEEKIERCFTNGVYNPVGGTHLSGFRGGVTRAINTYGKKEGYFKDSVELRGEDFREGLTAVIVVGHPDPLFESQTKIKLNNPEVEGLVSGVVYEALSEYLEKNPKEATRICKKIMLSAEARIAAKKAKDALRERKGLLTGGGLPGKLMDCTTRERDKSELFLVEGDSAGGSAEGGRDRHYQAVLPLRGKVLNVEKAEIEKLLNNNEIAALISAVGVDIGNAEDTSKLRYGRIVILTDADVDGQHIRTLLLTFFFRQMRKLVEDGRLFVARPPLFKVTIKKDVRFVQTREEMTSELMERGLRDTGLHVTAAASGGKERTLTAGELARVMPMLNEMEASVTILERRGQSFTTFVAKHTAAGFPMYHVRSGGKDHFFHTAEKVEEFRQGESKRLGQELAVSEAVPTTAVSAGERVPEAVDKLRFSVDEWHEVRALNKAVAKLTEFGFAPADLIPLPRVAGREPPVRFTLQSGESRKDLNDLRELVAEVRRLGERGMSVMRFKGLGEMNAEDLWDTTLDPAKRTLMQVTMADALQAEKMFRMLMGKEVEGRRDFILKHRANVEEIDYGA